MKVNKKSPIFRFAPLFFFLFFAISDLLSQDGKVLFQQKCASCHAVDKDLTGPGLRGCEERVPDKKLLIDWIRNNPKVLASGNKYFNDLYIKWNKVSMNTFSDLSDQQIESILAYVREWKPATKPVAGGQGGYKSWESSWLPVIFLSLLALLSLVLWGVANTMKKAASEKQGIKSVDKVPFYKQKINITLFVILCVGILSAYIVNSMIGYGRNKSYQPVQPIFYSHKVHAGINQINCMYCHTNAQQGKFAGIPSANVCMNCHAAIDEYKGEPIYNEEGDQINGTEEIKKLYAYVGWDAKSKKYVSDPKPIEWVRIHNLPDHVSFNHDQHVVNAKVQCQTCHGPIQDMDEVKQFSDLSMGWCVNCHRETKVAFKENAFYNSFEKYHNDLKDGRVDSITAAMIGANECQRCHY